jgi:hypothetical protein
MIKTIVIVVVLLVVAVGAVLAYAATKPATLRVQRTATIKAPPEKIFTLINDLRGWGAWSPTCTSPCRRSSAIGCARPEARIRTA